jgi:predicted DNA-binding transcriptional regulator YafY
MRRAIRLHERVVILYVDSAGGRSDRPVRPLVLEFWGRVWTLATWCETRGDFRSFRVDRIESLTLTGETFAEEPGKSLADWRQQAGSGSLG